MGTGPAMIAVSCKTGVMVLAETFLRCQSIQGFVALQTTPDKLMVQLPDGKVGVTCCTHYSSSISTSGLRNGIGEGAVMRNPNKGSAYQSQWGCRVERQES